MPRPIFECSNSVTIEFDHSIKLHPSTQIKEMGGFSIWLLIISHLGIVGVGKNFTAIIRLRF